MQIEFLSKNSFYENYFQLQIKSFLRHEKYFADCYLPASLNATKCYAGESKTIATCKAREKVVG